MLNATNQRVIVLDFGVFMHTAIFASKANPEIPSTYTCMNMILSCLKRIGIEPDDIVIVAVDFLRSWRKEFEDSYKADRAQKREDSGIDFKEHYDRFNELLEQLSEATSWHLVKIAHLEADDIMAVACRFFKDQEVILVTFDSDLEQCWEYPNVKIFSPKMKAYKVRPKNFNVYKVIAKKIEIERADNLTAKVISPADYEKREVCVKLISLPEWVETAVLERLQDLDEKSECLEKIPFKSIRARWGELYNDKSKVMTYEECVLKEEKKKSKKAKKEKTREEGIFDGSSK